MSILQNHGDVFPQKAPLDPFNGDTVNGDLPLCNVIESGQQVCNSRLARTGRTDKGNFLSGLGIHLT